MAEPDVIPSEQMYADALARARAAEGRVEALERALETLATAEDFVDEEDYQAFARAALACPPQAERVSLDAMLGPGVRDGAPGAVSACPPQQRGEK